MAGFIVIKRFGEGLGYELNYPIPENEQQRRALKEQLINSLEDIGLICRELNKTVDQYGGYKNPDRGQELAESAKEKRKRQLEEKLRKLEE